MSMRNAESFIHRILQRVLLSARRRFLASQHRGWVLLVASSFSIGLYAPVGAADLASEGVTGQSGNRPSSGVGVSNDGNFVAFFSDATNLVSVDTNQARDVFVRDIAAGTTERVSVSSSQAQANKASHAAGGAPGISGDGQIVAFYSDATNLVDNDKNGRSDVFIRDRAAGMTEIISVNTDGTQGNGSSTSPAISENGSIVAFPSQASNLVTGDTNGVADIFVRVRSGGGGGTTERLCGVQGNAFSASPSISSDGTSVAFAAAASNLVPGDTNGRIDIFVCDRNTNTIERVSIGSGGVQGDGDSILPAISGDGRFVGFKSLADNLVPNDRNGLVDVFVRDRCQSSGSPVPGCSPSTERVSVGFQGGDANDFSFPPTLSNDGRFVAFGSSATNLIDGGTNASYEFVRDRQIGVTKLISPSEQCSGGIVPNGSAPDVPPALTRDGSRIGLVSPATNFAPNDHNEATDVFEVLSPFFAPGSCPDSACPGGLVCVDGCCVVPTPTPSPSRTPTATKTPTPLPTRTPVPCFFDQDCPVGQVCEDRTCRPAPTPTPPILCPDRMCPNGLTCVDGICVDLSTPTPTRTPLPPCTKDEDCLPGFHCRAKVCVPVRECDDTNVNIDRLMCRGVRETCVDNACECGGDCNLDGFVLGNETSRMVCVLGGRCPYAECPAGDFNGDRHITANEVCAAVTNLGLGCPGEGQPLIAAQDRTSEIRSLDIGSGMGVPGGSVTIPINMGGGGEVATAQMDMLFDTRVLSIGDPSASCSIDTRLVATEAAFNFLPQTPDTPEGFALVRLFVGDLMLCRNDLAYPVDAFNEGPLLSCKFRILATAPLGPTTLTSDPDDPERLNVGDVRGNEFGVTSSPGTVTVIQQTCSSDGECPTGLVCRSNTCVAACTQDDECPSDQVCRNGGCVAKCTQDSDCPNGLVCRNDFCVPTCTMDSDCPDGLVCRQDVCVPTCTLDSDCPTGSMCENGGCVPTQCDGDSDCACGSTCQTHRCVPSPCAIDNDCASCAMCENGMCVPTECDDDHPCQPGQECVSGRCVVEATPTPTVKPECTTFTECGTSGRDACVGGKCVCAGDCDGIGGVTPLEITQAIQIFGEVLNVDACLAADQDGNRQVSALEITIAIQNFGLGCP